MKAISSSNLNKFLFSIDYQGAITDPYLGCQSPLLKSILYSLISSYLDMNYGSVEFETCIMYSKRLGKNVSEMTYYIN